MISGGCRICGGTVGDSRQVAHALCLVRVEHGLPTPSLGNECPCCHGLGNHPSSIVGPVNPTAADMDRWAPGCTTCEGSGRVGCADPDTMPPPRARAAWGTTCLVVGLKSVS